MTRLALSSVVGAATACILGACFLPGFEKVDGTGTGGTAGAGGGEEMCSARWPSPVAGTSAVTDSVTISLAMRTIDIGDGDVTNAPGFDLDRACTCCTECAAAQTCTPPTAPICDAALGRDNAMAHFLSQLEQTLVSPVTSSSLQADIAAGSWTVLLRVWGYNGMADDDNVTMALYATNALPMPPVWDGTDTWTVRSDYLVAPSMSLDDATVKSDVAYVAGGVLVGTFGSAGPLRLSLTGGFELQLSSAVIAGTLEMADGRYRLANATLGGLWSMPDVFLTLNNLRQGGMPVLCKGDLVYENTIKPLLCGLRDSKPGFDAPAPCDALSFGTSFVSEQVVIMGTSLPPDPGVGCMPGFEPLGDVCP